MRAGARNQEQSELRPKTKNTEPHTRRTLVMTSPGRKNKTGISISPSRLDPSLSESMSKDIGGSTTITETQRALVKKMEQLVGEHHYRRNSGVSSLHSLTPSNPNTSSNILGANKVLPGAVPKHSQPTPQDTGSVSGTNKARQDRSSRPERSQKREAVRETRILKVPYAAH